MNYVLQSATFVLTLEFRWTGDINKIWQKHIVCSFVLDKRWSGESNHFIRWCYLVPLFETRSFAVCSVNKYLRTVCKVWKWKRFPLWEWKEVRGWFTACFLCYYSAKRRTGKKTSEEEINIKFRLIDTVCFILISSKLQADRAADT